VRIARSGAPIEARSLRYESHAVFRMYDAQSMGSSAWPVRWSAFVVVDDHARAPLHTLARDEIAARRLRKLSESRLVIALLDEGER